jgi:hypothetical protein
MDYLKKLLADNAGDPSSMRVMAFISLFAGIGIGIIGLVQGRDLSSLAILCGVFIGVAFGGKAAQSAIENKSS